MLASATARPSQSQQGPVTITADLGGEKRLSEVSVDWEFPAKAFTVSVSTAV
jgi:hypothetical protein